MSNTPSNGSSQSPGKRTAALVLLVIFAITLILIYAGYRLEIKPQAYFARSINDASYDCEDKIHSHFDENLINAYYDQYSSRYEADDHQYLIYYRVTAQEFDDDDRPGIRSFMVKCVVWEKLGYVSDFQVFDKF